MELEFSLSREVDEPWGFRLIGGTDFSMPLTIVKVLPGSPAQRAGLSNGDTVITINNENTTEMTHEDSRNVLAECDRELTLGVVRGLYDPVLDDFDPTYEIDQDDSDQPLVTSEVFTPTEFSNAPADLTDLPHLQLCEFPDYIDTRKLHGLVPKQDFKPLAEEECRSLTASPFAPPTKPYRPFSTEPLPEVPPLEAPIILNPDYYDDFTKYVDEDLLPKSGFKLPISEQYDPDGIRLKHCADANAAQTIESNISESLRTELTNVSIQSTEINKSIVSKSETEIRDETMKQETIRDVQFREEMKQEIDLEKIEKTAISIVDESLEKAVAVAQEINKEINVELESLQFESQSETANCTSKESKTAVNVEKSSQNLLDEVDIRESVIEKAEKFESSAQQLSEQLIDEKRQTVRKDIEETIEAGSVKRKSLAFKEAEESGLVESKIIEARKSESVKHTDIREDITSETRESKHVREETKMMGAKMSTARLLSEQRAYTIGLQTIPHIKGTIHSSYHYDLLLKTFFIHLTDVMVALSRFILAEPVLADKATLTDKMPEKYEERVKKDAVVKDTCEITKVKKTVVKDTVSESAKVRQEVVKQKDIELQATKVENVRKAEDFVEKRAAVETSIAEQLKKDVHDKIEIVEAETSELIEKKKISGSKMAQLVEKKSEDLTQKMDAVITEFQVKSGVEEIAIESKNDKTQVDSVITSDTKSEVKTESFFETKDSTVEKRAIQTVQRYTPKTARPTYVAIVESHVYTNKDAILEEHFSGCSSLQSPEETTTAICEVSKDTVIDEKVALKEEVIKAADKKVTEVIAIDESLQKNEKIEKEQNAIVTEAVEVVTEDVQKVQSVEVAKVELKSAMKSQEVFLDKTESKSESIAEVKQEQITVADDKSVMKSDILSKEETMVKTKEISKKSAESHFKEKSMDLKETSEKLETTSVAVTEKPATRKNLHIVKKPTVSLVQNTEEISKKSAESHFEEKSMALKETSEKLETTSVAVTEKPATRKNLHIVKKPTVSLVQKTEEISKKSAKSHFEEKSMAIKETSEKLETTSVAVTENLATRKNLHIIKKPTVSLVQKTQSQADAKHIVKIESDEFAALKTTREEIKEVASMTKIEESDVSIINKQSFTTDISNSDTTIEKQKTTETKSDLESTFIAKSFVQKEEKSSITGNQEMTHKARDLTLDLKEEKISRHPSTQSTDASPSSDGSPTATPTAYLFKLQIPLPKGITPVPPDPRTPSPEEEDPNIVKKKLIPHIDTTIGERVLYDPPLPTPPTSQPTSPVYTKPGLRGGADKEEMSKEEIREITRKSSLLATAIDETIKSIEEYKQEVGMESESTIQNDQDTVVYNGFAKVVASKVYDEFNKANGNAQNGANGKTNDNNEMINNITSFDINNGNGFNKYNDIQSINVNEVNKVADRVVSNGSNDMIDNNDTLEGYRPVQFDPEEIQNALRNLRSSQMRELMQVTSQMQEQQRYKTETGALIGTKQGIVDGLEEAMVDAEVAKELGKPGMTEEKIAELISGESEMLREAHVMGLSRVLSVHMHKPDDSSVDFKRIKPLIESLNDSEVLKALNEEILKAQAERKKKEEKNWTTFLQKPQRPVPKVKFGYHGYVEEQEPIAEPYKVKIVKQPKPKVAPDYQPENFNTGLLPWEERALREPTPPPVTPEDPILIPEDAPEILEAVDPLPESEVPDLEDSGIPLPPPEPKEVTPPPTEDKQDDQEEDLDLEAIVEETERIVEENVVEEMDRNTLAEKLIMDVQNMLDPNSPLEQQLAQMKAQLSALAQLPAVIQHSLELLTSQLAQLSNLDSSQTLTQQENQEVVEEVEQIQNKEMNETETELQIQELTEEKTQEIEVQEKREEMRVESEMKVESEIKMETMRREVEEVGQEMMDEQSRIEKQKKELMDQMKMEQEARQLKQRSPRVGKPKPMFGPITPQERPLVLPGGRKWRNAKDAYNDQFISETLTAQAEIIMGKAKGCSFESVLLPYDERVNFMKWEKPPISLDHLKDSDTYKLIHNMEDGGMKKVAMKPTAMAEVDYREKCRSVTPCSQMQP